MRKIFFAKVQNASLVSIHYDYGRQKKLRVPLPISWSDTGLGALEATLIMNHKRLFWGEWSVTKSFLT